MPLFRWPQKPSPHQPRDTKGRYTTNRRLVIMKAQMMRDKMPGHVWRVDL